MSYFRNIENVDLIIDNKHVNFAIKTFQEIEAKRRETDKIEEPHRHNFYTIIWTIKASGKHTIDSNTIDIQNDMLFFIHPEQVHQVESEDKSPEVLAILFTEEFLIKNGLTNQFMNALNLFSVEGKINFIQLDENAEIKKLIRALQEVYQSNEHFKEAKLSAYLKLFLLESFNLKSNKPIESIGAVQPEIVFRFKNLVEQRYLEWHKVSEYADKLTISANYLNEIIKKNTGRTAKEHIQNRLASEAKRLSFFTQLSAKEIGFKLGFNDPSHFAKFSKKFVSKGNS
jgi:AraC-like DNA-binding protein/mannose-6-phosphate isomerase-like protein (cupin superfamily)